MTLTIIYDDGTTLLVKHVRTIEVVGPRMIRTATFGNDSVDHRNVTTYVAWLNFDDVRS